MPGGGGDDQRAEVWAVAGFIHADEDSHERSITDRRGASSVGVSWIGQVNWTRNKGVGGQRLVVNLSDSW